MPHTDCAGALNGEREKKPRSRVFVTRFVIHFCFIFFLLLVLIVLKKHYILIPVLS